MFTFRRILVPTDFSTHAAAALEHAVLLGARYNAEITLLHVDEFVVSPLGALGLDDEYLRVYLSNKQKYFEQQFAFLQKELAPQPVTLKTQIISGRAYKVIVEEAEKREFDLVVIATRGLTHLAQHLIGSTAERVVRFSRQPVLSVTDAPRSRGTLRSILCPTDLSPAANVALSYALSIARQYSAVLYIQYISELDKPESEADIKDRMPNLEDHHPEAGHVRVQYVFDRDVDPSNSIIRFSEDREIDLIVMSTHGRKGLRRVFVGNNTAEVVRQSTRPVLTVTHPFHKRIFSRPLTEHAGRSNGPASPRKP